MNTRFLMHAFVVAVGTTGALLSTAVTAADLPARGPVPFATYDANGDGAVSEAEFNAVREKRQTDGRPMLRAPSFAELDANHDGRLSPDELAAGQRAGMGGGMVDSTAGPGPGGGRGNMPAFADFDLDKNGRMTEAEFDEARAARMKQRAEEGRMMRGMADGCTFAEIDTNHDGSVTPEEFAVHQAAQRQRKGP